MTIEQDRAILSVAGEIIRETDDPMSLFSGEIDPRILAMLAKHGLQNDQATLDLVKDALLSLTIGGF